MLIILYAVVAVVAWGTWIGLADTVRAAGAVGPVKTFYVTVGNLVFAAVVTVLHGDPIRWLWLPFGGGLLWAVGNASAFLGTRGIGLARASGVWTCLNITMGLIWGAVLFDEFRGIGPHATTLWSALALVVVGLLLIVFAKGVGREVTADVSDTAPRTRAWAGLVGALGAGVLWGTYFIPIQQAGTSLWTANLSLSAGMVAGGSVLAVTAGGVRIRASPPAYLTLGAAGVLWGMGNVSMLLLTERIGVGKGFTIAQLSLGVNALVGIWVFRNPRPRSRAAAVTLAGVMLAIAGGVLLGRLK